MPLPTFTPVVAPSPGTGFAPEINLLTAGFGDGYTQSLPNGLNHIRQVVTLKWDGLIEAEMISIRTFFEQQAGYKPFYYKPVGVAAPLKWTCKEWSSSANAPWTFTAKLRQDFTLAT